MGEVYRARDSVLQRDVALKVLPDAFAFDRDRLGRFQREAHVLASLNHPNIGTIHGVQAAGHVRALVLELVEGPTLAVANPCCRRSTSSSTGSTRCGSECPSSRQKPVHVSVSRRLSVAGSGAYAFSTRESGISRPGRSGVVRTSPASAESSIARAKVSPVRR